MRIAWSSVAQADLEEIYDYIARDVPYYAEQFIDQMIASVDHLADHPRLGRRVPEAKERDDVRELIFHGYRILSLVESAKVFILAVIHGSRDLEARAAKPWEPS